MMAPNEPQAEALGLATLLALIGLVLVSASGCAARPASGRAHVHDRVLEALRLEQEGCYACLRQAATLYEMASAVSPENRAVSEALLRVGVLLALREREVGIAGGDVSDPSPGTASSRAVRLIGLMRMFPPHVSTVGPEELDAFNTSVRPTSGAELTASLLALASAPSDGGSDYVAWRIQCEYRDILGERERDAASHVESGLRAWHTATCPQWDRDRLVAVAARRSDWHEATYLLGLLALRVGQVDLAFDQVSAVADRLPGWIAAWQTLGSLHLAREEFGEADHRFRQVVERVPDQRQALLGLVIARSYAGLHEAAIDGATRMLGLGTYYVADALFWRAWNLARLARYAEAAEDIEKARTMLSNAPYFALAGIVARARGRLGEARSDLLAALALAPDDCDVLGELGTTDAAEEQWGSALAWHRKAFACREEAVHALEAQSELPSTPREDQRRRRVLEDAHRGRARAALGAAQALFYRGEEPATARRLLAVALAHPDTVTPARELLASIEEWR
jgi:tetratricopeptide (TPR) repeat protein